MIERVRIFPSRLGGSYSPDTASSQLVNSLKLIQRLLQWRGEFENLSPESEASLTTHADARDYGVRRCDALRVVASGEQLLQRAGAAGHYERSDTDQQANPQALQLH